MQIASSKYNYKAFISYSHAADGKLAPAVQRALQRFGKPWYSPASIQIFRDDTGLALTPDLWGGIQQRLKQSECFILLASSEAAQSQWVEKEIQFWLQHRPASPLLIVLTGGALSWGKDDFDWDKTNALPRSLQKAFKTEPLWADLSWAKTSADLSLRRPRFFVEIAKLIAGMRQESLEKVFDEAAVRHKKTMRLLWAAVVVLGVLAFAALGAAVVSFQAKRTADRLASDKQAELARAAEHQRQDDEAKRTQKERQRKEAASARLAAKAVAVLPEDRELSRLLALEAVNIAPTREAEQALRQTLLELVPPLVLQGHSDAVHGAQFSSDGRRALTLSADGTVRLWDAATGTNVLTLSVNTDAASGDRAFGILGSDGTKVLTMVRPESLAVGHWETPGVPRLYDATTGDLLATIADGSAVSASLSPDNTQIVTAGFDTVVKIWDARTGKIRYELPGHEQRVASASFSSNGNWIVTGSWDGTARIWESATGRNLAVLRILKGVEAAAFSPDGKKVLTVSDQRKDLQLWDWVNRPGGSLATFNGHEGSVHDFAFSADGKWLVTASSDHTARIWDTASGKCLHVLSGHEDFVNGVDVSPNGRWVVTASGDTTAQIWDAATGESLIQLGWDKSPRTCVAFSPDGKRIITGTADGAAPIYTYNVCGSVEDLLALAHSRVTRQLTPEERQKYLNKP